MIKHSRANVRNTEANVSVFFPTHTHIWINKLTSYIYIYRALSSGLVLVKIESATVQHVIIRSSCLFGFSGRFDGGR